MSPRRVPKLPRKKVYMDDRGRVVIPEYLREAIGLEVPGWVDVEAYPTLEQCKALFIKKA